MNKAVFLDRDGTINVEKNYLYKIEDFEFLPGTIEGLKLLHDAGFKLIVLTNQSGIGRGYYTEDDYLKLDIWLKKTLEGLGCPLTASYYCPHLPYAIVEKYRVNCNCRKPAAGMLEQAARENDIDLMESYAIGDRIRDLFLNTRIKRRFLVGATEENDTDRYEDVIREVDVLGAAKKILRIKYDKSFI